ncbi:hypothetical protein SAMN05421780_11027 [Flexibacter flexilis DSM 6793]|uniref:Uncharacterized protein n=1 Tax=Flexibacter flexilis DSM 6793 TaxID=927664 RepID=A0A1I1M4X2_9BACT|nr:hypothetical protein [Flexibacter flexilis]SFC80275.1 hypothetical protein SAMN05421780_11027 [Flexibacter flexilis DSM 6793]
MAKRFYTVSIPLQVGLNQNEDKYRIQNEAKQISSNDIKQFKVYPKGTKAHFISELLNVGDDFKYHEVVQFPCIAILLEDGLSAIFYGTLE